jgi:hypothetical protein
MIFFLNFSIATDCYNHCNYILAPLCADYTATEHMLILDSPIYIYTTPLFIT